MSADNNSFTLICNNCGNAVELFNGFERYDETIYINTWMSVDIECKKCGFAIEESVE